MTITQGEVVTSCFWHLRMRLPPPLAINPGQEVPSRSSLSAARGIYVPIVGNANVATLYLTVEKANLGNT